MTWDNGFKYNSSAEPSWSDYVASAKYYTYANGAGLALQVDARRAYLHYRGASGDDLQVDYDKAIRQDKNIELTVTRELDFVKEAIE